VTIQLVFNLVFVAALAGLFQNQSAVARARADLRGHLKGAGLQELGRRPPVATPAVIE
jgi:hypothetical protein